MVPEVIVALPATATSDDGRTIVKGSHRRGHRQTGRRRTSIVLPVLVHDLRFSVATANPAAVSAAVDREGIVSDALGNYDTVAQGGQLSISYTGPLLGDETVESVREGIGRQAHTPRGRRERGPQVRDRNRRGHGRRTAVGSGTARRPGNTRAHGMTR